MKTIIHPGKAFAATVAANLLTLGVGASFAFADSTPPTVPSSVALSNVSTSSLTVSWGASTDDVGVSGYGVFRNGTQIATTTAPSYNDSGLSPSTSYAYTVDAFDAAGNLSTQSASVSTSTVSSTAPSVPTNLVATSVSSSQVNLSWSASSDSSGVAGYYIYRNGVQIASTAATSYSDTGLSASMGYTYTVAAYNSYGSVSSQSASSYATTFASSSSDSSAPSIPSSLSATAVSASQVNLMWSASSDNVGVSGYRIYRNGVQITTTTATSYSDTGLAASTGYTYTVAAYDSAGNVSGQSNTAYATTYASGTVSSPSTYTVPPTLQIDSNGNITIHGLTVTSVGTNTLTGTIWGMTYTVNYNSSTSGYGGFQFYFRNGNVGSFNASQIQVGDQLGIQGSITASSPSTIQAQTVRNYSITTSRVQNNNGSYNSNMNNISYLQQLLQQLEDQFKTLQRYRR